MSSVSKHTGLRIGPALHPMLRLKPFSPVQCRSGLLGRPTNLREICLVGPPNYAQKKTFVHPAVLHPCLWGRELPSAGQTRRAGAATNRAAVHPKLTGP